MTETKSPSDADHLRVVDDVGRLHVDHRVVVRPSEEPLRAHDLPHVHAPAVQPLARVGDHARFDERQHVVDQERVHAEVALAPERLHDGLGDRAHADLHRGAVGDEVGHVAGDAALDVADGRRRVFGERMLDLDPAVDLGAVQEGVAERPRHRGIDLRDHERGAPRRRRAGS